MSRSPSSRRIRLLLAALAAMLLACGGAELREVPPFLRGDWTTEAPRYAGRQLQIRAGEVIFRGPQGIVDRIRVERVERSSGATSSEQIYLLHHRLPHGDEDAIRLSFHADATPSIRLGSRADRWTRAGRS